MMTITDKRHLLSERYDKYVLFWKAQFDKASGAYTFRQKQEYPGNLSPREEWSKTCFEPNFLLEDKAAFPAADKDMGLFLYLLSSFAVLLKRYSSHSTITVDSPFYALPEKVAPFGTRVPLILTVDEEDTLEGFLTKTRKVVRDSYRYQNIPPHLSKERKEQELSTSNIRIIHQGIHVNQEESQHYDLNIVITRPAPSRVIIEIRYRDEVFDDVMVKNFAGHWNRLLANYSNLAVRVKDLSILGEAEKETICKKFNPTAAPVGNGRSWIEEFERLAVTRPHAVAAEYDHGSITYGQLNNMANRLAKTLREDYRVLPGDYLAILGDRSLHTLIAILGVHKAGGAFLPIDPSLPDSRKKNMLQDAGIKVMLTESFLLISLASYWTGAVFALDLQLEESPDPVPNGCLSLGWDAAAYVMYTSGTSGWGKGVRVNHGSLLNYLQWADRYYLTGQQPYVFAWFTPLAFDLTLTSLLLPLLRGDRLVIFPPADPVSLLQLVLGPHSPVTVVKLTPSHVSLLSALPAMTSRVEKVILGGEAVRARHLQQLRQLNAALEVYNEYGPTEATIGCTASQWTGQAGQLDIGQPIDNAQLYVLDEYGRLQPPGVSGEICIGGACLSAGYLNQVELTDERFMAHPYRPGERLYRSGDRGKWQQSGQLLYLGRCDQQVKIRGYRVELAELEGVLARHPQIEAALVETYGQEPVSLRAYLVSQADLSYEQVLSYLCQHLPAYMLPSQVLLARELPLTVNGKADLGQMAGQSRELRRSALPGSGPATATEAHLLAIWQEVLSVAGIGTEDNFFALGGDSIKAIRLVSRYNQAWGAQLEVKDVFAHQHIGALAAYLLGKAAVGEDGRQAAAEQWALLRQQILGDAGWLARLPSDWEDFYPMSEIEKGMVFHNWLDGQQGMYHDQFYHQIQDDCFDFAVLGEAFGLLVAKHEILRTSFHLWGFPEPLQVVHGRLSALPVSYESLSHLQGEQQRHYLEAYMAGDRQRRFRVEEAGLWRLVVFGLGQGEYGLVLIFHHAILDGWSRASLMTELSQGYYQLKQGGSWRAGKLLCSYRDFVLDQRRVSGSGVHRQYWQQQLLGYERTPLPLAKNNPGGSRLLREKKSYSLPLGPPLSNALQKLVGKAQMSAREIGLAAFCYLIRLTSNCADPVIGLVTQARPEVEDGERILGCFLNTIPFRLQLPTEIHPDELLKVVKTKANQIKGHEKLPLTHIAEEWSQQVVGENPIFDITFNYTAFHIYREQHVDTQVRGTMVESFENTNTCLDGNLAMEDENAFFTLSYLAGLYQESEAKRLAEYFVRIMAMIIRSEVLTARALVGKDELANLMRWNATARSMEEDSILAMFSRQVEQRPQATAVTFGEYVLTYRQLWLASEQVSRLLQAQYKVQAGELVGILMERSERMLIAILAVMQCRAAYVPIDPEYPGARTQYIIRDTDVKVIIADDEHALSARQVSGCDCFALTRDSFRWADGTEANSNLVVFPQPQELAYVMYTSGTTGHPKGVCIPHCGLTNRLEWMWQQFGFNCRDVILQKTPHVFDVSVWELLMPIGFGASLVICPREVIYDPVQLSELMEKCCITTLHFVPGFYKSFLEMLDLRQMKKTTALQRVFVSGEALLPETVLLHYQRQGVPLYNLYGPTEASVDVSYYLTGTQDEQVAIGKPIWNMGMHVLSEEMTLLPVGAVGEICLEGIGLAQGYLNQAELTAGKFVHDNLGRRLYRTGDFGWWRSDGNLMFSGRKDDQVKVRGFRVEIKEVENALLGHWAVENAVVLVRRLNGISELTACYKGSISAEKLRSYLLQQLPAFMVPDNWVAVEEFPFTPNGKIDRKALALLEQEAGHTDFVAPGDDLERKVAAIWEEVLAVKPVSIRSNFFTAGGNSLKVLQVLTRIQKELNVRIELKELFANPTIESLAAEIKLQQWASSKQQEVDYQDNSEIIII